MYKDNQERVDAYLRGEMDNQARIQFEKELKSDDSLAKVYRETKAISDAIADRKKKLDMMVRWNKEEEIRAQLISRRNNIRRWTIGMSAAACIAVGFFAVRPMFITTSSPTSDFAMPNFGNEVYYRGGDSSMELLDSLINVKDYEQALVRVDSLLLDYNSELKQYDGKDSLTEKEEYEKAACKEGLEELNWRRANLLIALGKTEEAKDCLQRIVNGKGYYAEQADSLLKMSLLK
ncbi:MAG: hypothetical protein NC453_22805 [Muribaculum sp.]|nr:hypothetical protein [Muribaculum sp.]